MRLAPGGIRELHWHKEAEWAYMIAGECRVSVLDEEGRLFIDDVGVGDLWYFPAGLPHSIQALENGAEFLLVFDSANFSENETFLITDWFNHTPRDVLAKNFGVAESAFDNLPTDIAHTRYMFAGQLPPALSDDAPPYPAIEPRAPTPGTCTPRSRPRPRAARCGSPTRATSPSPSGSLQRWSRPSRVESASCTGTPTPTSGSTTCQAKAG